MLPTPRELGFGLVPFSPLGRGFLSGNVQRAEEVPAGDFRRTDLRYQGTNFGANVAAAEISLSESEIEQLDVALAKGKIAGPRYISTIMETVDR